MKNDSIPDSWKWIPLEKLISSLESGNRPKGGVKKYESGIPSIGGEHLDNKGGFNFTKIKFVPNKFYEKLSKGIIQENDILIVKDGATTGKISFVDNNFPFKQACVNEHVFILRMKNEIVFPKYIFRYLFSLEGQKKILKEFKGSAQGGINRKFVKNILIPVPPTVTKQEKISEKIEYVLENLQLLFTKINLIKNELIVLKKSILHYSFLNNTFQNENQTKNFLKQILEERHSKWSNNNGKRKYGIPRDFFKITTPYSSNWELISLESVCYHLESGGTPSRSEPENFDLNGYPLLKVENISKNGEVAIKKEQLRLSKKAFTKQKKSTVNTNDLLVNIVGPPLGKIGIIPAGLEESNINQALVLLRTVPSYNSKLLWYILRSAFYNDLMYKMSKGDRQSNIRKSEIGKIPIPLIPKNYQSLILKQLEDSFKICTTLENNIKNVELNIHNLTDSLFFKVFHKSVI